MQALHDVSRQAAGIRHDLHTGEHLGALERHAARHDQADIARAQDEHALADHVALDIEVALRGTRGKYARRARARDADRTAGALAAAHGQHDRVRIKHLIAAGRGDDMYLLIRRDLEHHGVQTDVHAGLADHFDKPSRVFRTGQFFLKVMQAKAIMDALVQDTAQFPVAFDNADRAAARFPGSIRRGQARRAAADDHKLVFHA